MVHLSRRVRREPESNPEPAGPSGLQRHSTTVRNKVVDRIRLAMRSLEADLECGAVLRSKITQAELCRRAGIAKAALQKPSHRDSTLPEVRDWVARTAAKKGSDETNAVKPDRISDLRLSLDETRQKFHEVELELVEAKDQIERLRSQLQTQ